LFQYWVMFQATYKIGIFRVSLYFAENAFI
jgi:hypothetical protein